MKRTSQIFHFIGVIVITWLGGTLYYNASPEDPIKIFLQYLGSVIFILWPIIVLFYSVQTEDPLDKDKLLIKAYRFLLNKKFFLYTSNIVLTVCTLLLIFFALWYRPVEFKTHHEGKVRIFYDKDLTGNDPEIGIIDSNTPLTLRLHAGSYDLYFKSTTGNEVLKNELRIKVTPFFTSPGKITFFLDYDEENLNDK